MEKDGTRLESLPDFTLLENRNQEEDLGRLSSQLASWVLYVSWGT
jgi:hypothetical protein